MPTFVSEQESVWNTTTSPKTTGSFNIATGDALVAVVAEENFETGQTFNLTNSGTALTWTKTDVSGMTNNSDCYGSISRALVGANQTGITATCTRSGGSAGFFGFNVLRFSGVASFGTPVSSASARQVSITTTAANSSIVVLIADWSAAAQATRTYLQPAGASTPVEVTYFNNTANYTVCGYYIQDAGAAGAKTVGISNAMTTPICIAIELVGAASGTTHALASTGTGTSTGSLALGLVQKTSSTGTGTSTGSINLLLAPGAMSATGAGQTTGSANLLLAPGALSATGTGQTAGSAALSLNAALTATGAGQTAGSVDVTLDAAPLTLSATGTGSSTGSLAVNLQLSCSSTGTGASTGSLALDIVGGPLGLSATGTGQTGGSAALTATLALGSTGSGSTTGSAALVSTFQLSSTGTGTTTGSASSALILGLSATGTGQTAGSLDVTIPFGDTYALSATGTGTTAGSLELTPLLAISASGQGTTAGSLVLIRSGQLRAISVGATTSGSLVLSLRAKLSASGAGQTAGSMAMRISLHRLTATGYTFSSGSLELSEPRFVFSMPTHEEPFQVNSSGPFRVLAYHRLTYAPSLVKVGGQWTTFRTPPPELLEGLTAGEDYFLGGFEYEISQQLARELALAGYTANPI